MTFRAAAVVPPMVLFERPFVNHNGRIIVGTSITRAHRPMRRCPVVSLNKVVYRAGIFDENAIPPAAGDHVPRPEACRRLCCQTPRSGSPRRTTYWRRRGCRWNPSSPSTGPRRWCRCSSPPPRFPSLRRPGSRRHCSCRRSGSAPRPSCRRWCYSRRPNQWLCQSHCAGR